MRHTKHGLGPKIELYWKSTGKREKSYNLFTSLRRPSQATLTWLAWKFMWRFEHSLETTRSHAKNGKTRYMRYTSTGISILGCAKNRIIPSKKADSVKISPNSPISNAQLLKDPQSVHMKTDWHLHKRSVSGLSISSLLYILFAALWPSIKQPSDTWMYSQARVCVCYFIYLVVFQRHYYARAMQSAALFSLDLGVSCQLIYTHVWFYL